MGSKMFVEGSVRASHMKELWRQIEEKKITGAHMNALLERRNPYLWFKNLGKINLSPYGGEETIRTFENEKILVCRRAKDILGSKKPAFNCGVARQIPVVAFTPSHLGIPECTYFQIEESIIGTEVSYENKPYVIDYCPQGVAPFALLEMKGERIKNLNELREDDAATCISKVIVTGDKQDQQTSLLQIRKTSDSFALDAVSNLSPNIVDNRFAFDAMHWMIFSLSPKNKKK